MPNATIVPRFSLSYGVCWSCDRYNFCMRIPEDGYSCLECYNLHNRENVQLSENVCQALYTRIAHGDEQHRQWLKKELEQFFEGL